MSRVQIGTDKPTRAEAMGYQVTDDHTDQWHSGRTTPAETEEYTRLAANGPSVPALPRVRTPAIDEAENTAIDALTSWQDAIDTMFRDGLLGNVSDELERRLTKGTEATMDSLTRQRVEGLQHLADLRATATARCRNVARVMKHELDRRAHV